MRNRQNELLELLDRSGPALHAMLTRLTMRREVAEELMQELFIKLNNVRNGEKVVNWDAYARRAAVNLALDWRRRRKSSALALERVAEPVSPDVCPLGGLIRAEELEETLDAMSRLKDTSRRILVMRYIQQQSYERIAEEVGKTDHQIRALCTKALARLRGMLTSGASKSSYKESCNVENR